MKKDHQRINAAISLIKNEQDALCNLEGVDPQNPLERAFMDCLHVYEEALFLKNGRRNKATYLRRSWAKHGVEETINRAVHKTSTIGFDVLRESEGVEHSLEMLAVRYSRYFDKKVVQRALEKLDLLQK